MMWFDKSDPRALFHDKRNERCEIPPNKAYPNGTTVVVEPDVVGDFTSLEFPDNTFRLVVFDPPHVRNLDPSSDIAKKYGYLVESWRSELRAGFSECFRVLQPGGILIFKWGDVDISLSSVLDLVDEKPLFGHTSGYRAGSHWITFMKPTDSQKT